MADATTVADTVVKNLPKHTDPQYLAMCLVARNQHADMLEWIHHYLALGVGRIYIYDHGSVPPMLPIFAHLEVQGVIEYHWITSDMVHSMLRPHPLRPKYRKGQHEQAGEAFDTQHFVYQRCMARYRDRHQWIAFFDADEFLLLKDPSVKDLPTFLKDYEQYGGLVVHWKLFGSSGHLLRPNGSTLESYTACMSHDEVKVIANTRFATVPCHHPHNFAYKDGAFAVNEALQRVDSSNLAQQSREKIVLYHYVIKSLAEFVTKYERGSADGGRRGLEYLKKIEEGARETCDDAVRLMAGRVWTPPETSYFCSVPG